MRKIVEMKKFAKVIVLSLALCMTAQTVAPASVVAVAEAAAKVKMNVAKKSIKVGKSYTLKVIGNSKKVSWSSSNKAIATVTSKGNVTGKSGGTATITAKVGEKKYTCKIVVTGKKINTDRFVEDAPFEAVKSKLGNANFVIPKSWETTTNKANGMEVGIITPKEYDKKVGTSNISITCIASEVDNSNYDLYKEMVEAQITEEALQAMLEAQGMTGVKVKDFSITTEKMGIGKVLVISYSAEMNDKKVLSQKIYDVFANGYTTEITVTDNGIAVEPNIYDIANYMIESLTVTK